MSESVHYLNVLLGLGAIALQVLVVVTFLVLFFGPKRNFYLDFIDKHFLAIGFILSLSAALFSLVYSEIIGYLPCYLCWYQRVFMFPVVFIFGIATWHKDRRIVKYVMPLLLVGLFIAVYQSFGYYFADAGTLPCDASGVSCYQQLVYEFGGYISIPMLSLTSFLSLITVTLVAHFYKKED
jgi:disulfide bond formation protein DsbB